jgi:hypothetical protein
VLAGEQVSSDPIDCGVDLGLLVVGPLVVGTIASAFGRADTGRWSMKAQESPHLFEGLRHGDASSQTHNMLEPVILC